MTAMQNTVIQCKSYSYSTFITKANNTLPLYIIMFHLTGILVVLFLLEAAAFAPLQNRAQSSSSSLAASSTSTNVDTEISDCLNVLNKAAESRAEDPELVFDALTKLEKLQRTKAKTDPSVATNMLSALNGSWRLVFTTGTADTQSKIKGKVNYFPLKVLCIHKSYESYLYPSCLTP